MKSHQARAAAKEHRALPDIDPLYARFEFVRRWTQSLCAALEPEDCVLQSMPDASPVKWHLAHTTWFFETFVLTPHAADYRMFNPAFGYLFNSYYNAIGPRWPRPHRGLLSRPNVAEVFTYRAHVDAAIARLCQTAKSNDVLRSRIEPLIEIGLHHEQQHQELIVTDIKHAFSINPLQPKYSSHERVSGEVPEHRWLAFPDRLVSIGHVGTGFAFDNESPKHSVYLRKFQIASRPITNREYRDFIEDGGYARPEFWLSDGWTARQTHLWEAPLYWDTASSDVTVFTSCGRQNLHPDEPVCHLSYYEADAFARWASARLPTEAEWETAADTVSIAGHFLESQNYHPAVPSAEDDSGALKKMFGDVWQWTASPYVAYPGYVPSPGALGEYNGKFMCNQIVLRGASCVTPRSHSRRTYRNFFSPESRWQFAGVRLAQDLS